MLTRLLALFTPIFPPKEGALELVGKVSKSCEVWAELKCARLARWARDRGRFKDESERQYLAEKKKLLGDLAEAGKGRREALRSIDEFYEPNEENMQATRDKGFNINPKILESHTYVSREVMDQLDTIYTECYQPDGARALRRCFNMMGPSKQSLEALDLYQKYLAKVSAKLVALSSSTEAQDALVSEDLQALGLTCATKRLETLFFPLHGKINLPLPTASMLDDLKGCLEVDPNVMSEVLKFFIHARLLTDFTFRLAVGSKDSGSTQFPSKATTAGSSVGPTWWG